MNNNVLIKNGKILIEKQLKDADLLVENGRITQIGSGIESKAAVYDIKGKTVIPGFIDVHTHGAVGVDMNYASKEDLLKVGKYFASQGVTGYLPTLLTDTKEQTLKSLTIIKDARESSITGSKILGVHLEGPYLVKEYKGAMPEHLLQSPSLRDIDDYEKLAAGGVLRITVSAEIAGMPEFIEGISKRGIQVSIGHSGADYETAYCCINKGATSATHIFNAMRLPHQHEPAISGAALESDIYCEAICDGFHLHPGIVRLLLKVKGFDKVIAVTDSIMASGLGDGAYKLGVNDIVVVDGDATLAGLETRAGSTLTMIKALQNLMKFTGEPVSKLSQLLSENPARMLGLDKEKGTLEVGKYGDFVIINEDFNIDLTFVEGKLMYHSDKCGERFYD